MLVSFVLSESKPFWAVLMKIQLVIAGESLKKSWSKKIGTSCAQLPWQTTLIISSLLNFCALNVSFVSFDNFFDFFTSQVTCKFSIPLKVCVHSLWSCNSFKLSNDACLFNFISLLSLKMQAKNWLLFWLILAWEHFSWCICFPDLFSISVSPLEHIFI